MLNYGLSRRLSSVQLALKTGKAILIVQYKYAIEKLLVKQV